MRIVPALVIIGILALALVIAGCTETPPQETGQVGILYSAAGPMPSLLATDQIDGFLIWQPQVELASASGIGKIISYTQDLPPGIWNDHTCCALIVREDQIQNNPDLVNAMSALTIVGVQYIRDNPDRSVELTAEWLFGTGNVTVGNATLNPVDVEKVAMRTFNFTTDITDNWVKSNEQFVQAYSDLGYINGRLKGAPAGQVDSILFNFGPYHAAKKMLEDGQIVTPAPVERTLAIGYLPSDHDAPLFVLLKDWEYFNNIYGITLKPSDLTAQKPEQAELIVNGQKVADIRIVLGQGGAGLMTNMGQDAVQFAYAGTPPAILAIDQGTPAKILHPIHTEGSALVIASDAPANDWTSFVAWAKQRSAEGKPLKIATAQNSIQDVILRYALKDAGLSASLVQ